MPRKKNYQKRCFEAAFDAACDNEALNPVICHGYCREGNSPFFIGHAWVEIGNDILDYTRRREPISQKDYYVVFVPSLKKYTLKDYAKLALDYNNYGPYHCGALGGLESESSLREFFNT